MIGWKGTIFPGCTPLLAASTTLGFEALIRTDSSLEANPPNTTLWTAPTRAHAIIAIVPWGEEVVLVSTVIIKHCTRLSVMRSFIGKVRAKL